MKGRGFWVLQWLHSLYCIATQRTFFSPGLARVPLPGKPFSAIANPGDHPQLPSGDLLQPALWASARRRPAMAVS